MKALKITQKETLDICGWTQVTTVFLYKAMPTSIALLSFVSLVEVK